MPAKKYDWKKLKEDFMTGEYKGISEFLRAKIGQDVDIDSRTFRGPTKGWLEEKETLKQKALDKALDEWVKKQKRCNELAMNVKFNSFVKLNKKIFEDKGILPVHDLTDAIKTAKNEIGEITDKTDNTININVKII